MKKLLIVFAVMLMTGIANAGYYDIQHGQVISKSTTTIVDTYQYRGNFAIGQDTYTIRVNDVQKNVVLYGTGTIHAKTIEADTFIAGTTIGVVDSAVRVSTGSLQTQINSVIVSTGSLQTQINNVIVSTGSLQTQINAIGVNPTGTIITYISSSSIPTGYLYCNGQSVSTTTYSTLYSVIGFQFGNPGSGNMNLPDFRGVFLRGLDNGRGYDADGYRVVGSTQSDTMQNHAHNFAGYTTGSGGTYAGITTANATAISPVTHSVNSGVQEPIEQETPVGFGVPRVSMETRPDNVAVVYLIKY